MNKNTADDSAVYGYLFLTSPFAALASLMLVLLVGSLFWTISTLVQTIIRGDTKSDSPCQSADL